MVEIADMIARLDVPDGEAVNQLRIVKLNNSLASDLAPIIQQAILAASEPLQTTQGAQGAAGGAGGNDAQQQRNLQARSLMLQMLTFDENGERRLTSGLLNDVRVTPDPRANALVVSAPSDSMPLLLALIDQLDKMPPAVAQIKVFTVVNADATRLAETLETLYTNQAGADQPAIVTAAPGDQESTLIPLRIAVEPRSNSVIVSGSSGDLTVVEAILLKLDVTDSQKRQTYVYRLNNSYAPIVATAITELLNQRRQLEQGIQADLRSPFELLEREVIVVAEEITNSLIISATQKYYDEVIDWIEKLDERPPMVVIQVVIAEVTLGDVDEFGVQMGLQDSLLFDRSVAGVPGFNFNNAPLGNNVAAAGANRVGTQGLSDLSIGRMNSDLGFGGLVFSASSESVSVLLRALRQERKVQVLSRPQITTLDNQLAFVQVGADVPRVQGTTVATNGSTVNDVVDTPTGVILEVTPRISPDGMVVMEIDAINSRLGPEAEGVPVSIAPNGDVVRQPQIEKITARASIMAADGQTIVFGGLIGTNSETVKRTVPVLGEIPLLRRLFTYELQEDTRRELLFIMTPHIVKNREDLEAIKQIESSRMSWCLSDVIEIHGDGSPGGLGLAEKGLPVVYPDLDPAGENISPPTPTDGPADQFSPPSNLREYQPSLEPAPDTTLNDSRPRDARPRINRLPDADSVDRRETARLPDREETRRFDDRRGYDDQRRPESDYRDRTPYEATPAGYNQPATGPWPPAYR
jgi:type II secretion system protein D